MFLPLVSARRATLRAAATAAPEEIPARMPSILARSLAVSNASSLVIVTISSMMLLLRTSGTKPAPIPWILWGPGLPPERTGDAAGSTATVLKEGLRLLITSDTPVKITGQTGEILADTLAIDLNTNRMTMKGNVRGTLTASGEAAAPPRGPLRIQSEELAADMNADTAEFSDRVRVVDDVYTITADRLTVHFKPQAEGQSRMAGAVSSRDLSRVVARGRVVVRTQGLTAGGDAGEFEPDTGRAALWGEKAPSPGSAAINDRGRADRPSANAEAAPGRVRVAVIPSADRR